MCHVDGGNFDENSQGRLFAEAPETRFPESLEPRNIRIIEFIQAGEIQQVQIATMNR